jgi:hypothetical protein
VRRPDPHEPARFERGSNAQPRVFAQHEGPICTQMLSTFVWPIPTSCTMRRKISVGPCKVRRGDQRTLRCVASVGLGRSSAPSAGVCGTSRWLGCSVDRVAHPEGTRSVIWRHPQVQVWSAFGYVTLGRGRERNPLQELGKGPDIAAGPPSKGWNRPAPEPATAGASSLPYKSPRRSAAS